MFRWYNKHLNEFGNRGKDEERISVVLLTNDIKNKEKAMEEGIEVYTGNVFRYFDSWVEYFHIIIQYTFSNPY